MKSLLFLVVFVFLMSCGHSIEDPYDFYFNTPKLGETAHNIEILYSDSTYVQVRITGKTLYRTSEAGQVSEEFPDGVQVEFLDRAGRPNSWLTAKKGYRRPNAKVVILRDSVVMHNAQQESLRTSELTWNEIESSIYTTKYVEIRRPGEIIKGFGFKTNEGMTEYEINAVTGRIKSDDIDEDFQ